MQVPIRKPGKYTHAKPDPHLTQSKFDEFKKKLEILKSVNLPETAKEVARLAELGDFSENFAYQMAKGKLRGINQRITEIEDHLSHAVIIEAGKNTQTVQLGNTVTVEINGIKKSYQLLGSSETDPQKGVISYSSPLGAALMGHSVGDTVQITASSSAAHYRIVKIE